MIAIGVEPGAPCSICASVAAAALVPSSASDAGVRVPRRRSRGLVAATSALVAVEATTAARRVALRQGIKGEAERIKSQVNAMLV